MSKYRKSSCKILARDLELQLFMKKEKKTSNKLTAILAEGTGGNAHSGDLLPCPARACVRVRVLAVGLGRSALVVHQRRALAVVVAVAALRADACNFFVFSILGFASSLITFFYFIHL